MSLRLEMLQVARLAPKLLAESTELVERFLRSQQTANGGFRDRMGQGDLYYTVFGLEGLLAIRTGITIEPMREYLLQFGAGTNLDFVHLCCLARCWAALSNFDSVALHSLLSKSKTEILQRIELFRSRDGGYHPAPRSEAGTVYGCFLAFGAYQDFRADCPEPLHLVQCLKLLETSDGAWANERGMTIGSTNATAAAVALLRQLKMPINSEVGDWLLARAHPQGGFVAAPEAPMPDLLSTATALHALAGLQRDFSGVRERCLDFVDSLWTNEGGFHGLWADEALDCEYTYYGLLALGHLSLEFN